MAATAAALVLAAACCCQAFLLPPTPPATSSIVRAPRAMPTTVLYSSTGTAPPQPAAAASQGVSEEVAKDLRTIQDYLNGKHGELLEKFAMAYTPTGEEMRKKNFWRGDAFSIAKVAVEALDLGRMRLVVTTKETGMFGGEKLSEERQDIVFSKSASVISAADSPISRCLTHYVNQSFSSESIVNSRWPAFDSSTPR